MADLQQETTSNNEALSEAPNSNTEAPNPAPEQVPEAPVQETEISKENVNSDLSQLLSEELKEVKSLQNFKDVDGLAKSYVHLNGLLGKKFDELTPDELDSYYNKLGRPESAEEYNLPDSPQEDMVKWYKEKAYDAGLSQEQTRKLMDSYMEIEQLKMKEYQQQQETTTAQWIEEIKADFGPAFDKRLDIAKKAVTAYGGEELKDYLNQTGLGNHPAMVKAFSKIGRELVEDRLTDAEASKSFGMTPKEALQKVATLKRDPTFMKSYQSAMAPGHEEAVDEIQELYKIAYNDDK